MRDITETLDAEERAEIARERDALRYYTRRQPWWTPTEKMLLLLDAERAARHA